MTRGYVAFDTNYPYKNPGHMIKFDAYDGSDLCGHVVGFAKQNNSEVADIRLFCFPSIKKRNEFFNHWLGQIEF